MKPLTLEDLNLSPIGHPFTIGLMIDLMDQKVEGAVDQEHLKELATLMDRYCKEVMVISINNYLTSRTSDDKYFKMAGAFDQLLEAACKLLFEKDETEAIASFKAIWRDEAGL